MSSEGKYKAPALEKGLDIVELLSTTPNGLSQKEIADALGRSLSEIFRMLVCLNERGYIALQPGTDRYELTLKLFELAHRHPPIKRLVEKAVPIMRELTHNLEQSCHLAVYKDNQMLVVAQVDSPANHGFSVRLGARLPSLTKAASGQVILAYNDESTRRQMLEFSGEEYSEELMALLDSIKQTGYVESPSLYVRGIYNQTFPIFNYTGEVIAALTVPYVAQLAGVKSTRVEVRKALKESSERLSAMLGAPAR